MIDPGTGGEPLLTQETSLEASLVIDPEIGIIVADLGMIRTIVERDEGPEQARQEYG